MVGERPERVPRRKNAHKPAAQIEVGARGDEDEEEAAEALRQYHAFDTTVSNFGPILSFGDIFAIICTSILFHLWFFFCDSLTEQRQGKECTCKQPGTVVLQQRYITKIEHG